MNTATLTILGSSAALPAKNRNLSAHLLELDGHSLLFDCGEATQFQLKRYRKKIHKISHIFISHLHGDHLYGLPGLISSMHMLDRKKPLIIYGPKGIKEYLDVINSLTDSEPKFDVICNIIATSSLIQIIDEHKYTVEAFPLKHSVETYGYRFQQKTLLRNIKPEFIENNNVKVPWFNKIKNGEDYINEVGKVFPNSTITNNPPEVKSYAYCSDTAYFEQLAEYVKNVGLLYHESTFLIENNEDAISKMHSTATDAANIAVKSGAKQLLLGHFSARYDKVELFEKEAKPIFDNVIIANEGLGVDL